jgi:4-aminobutyrate aminotransferase
LKEERLLENATNMGAYALVELEKLKKKHKLIKNIRGVGLMIGIELQVPETGKPNGEAVMEVLDECLKRGVLFYLCGNSGEVIRMIPPLTISKEQIDTGIDVLNQALLAYKA